MQTRFWKRGVVVFQVGTTQPQLTMLFSKVLIFFTSQTLSSHSFLNFCSDWENVHNNSSKSQSLLDSFLSPHLTLAFLQSWKTMADIPNLRRKPVAFKTRVRINCQWKEVSKWNHAIDLSKLLLPFADVSERFVSMGKTVVTCHCSGTFNIWRKLIVWDFNAKKIHLDVKSPWQTHIFNLCKTKVSNAASLLTKRDWWKRLLFSIETGPKRSGKARSAHIYTRVNECLCCVCVTVTKCVCVCACVCVCVGDGVFLVCVSKNIGVWMCVNVGTCVRMRMCMRVFEWQNVCECDECEWVCVRVCDKCVWEGDWWCE